MSAEDIAGARPWEYLREAEQRSIAIQKLLRSNLTRAASPEQVGDALQRLDLIETISRFGKTVGAEEAITTAELVEQLFDETLSILDALFAPQPPAH